MSGSQTSRQPKGKRALFGLPPVVRAVLWFGGTMAGFAGMAVSARELYSTMSMFEILFFRNSIAILVMLPFALRLGRAGFRTTNIGLHAARAVIQIGGQAALIYGVAWLALAEVTALEFTVPLWTALFAVLFLGERMTGHKWLATIGGFIGVLIILQPDAGTISLPALAVLGGAACYALSGILVKYLTRTEGPQIIVLYMNLLQLPMGLIPALFVWVTPVWADVPWILIWGVSGLFAHYTMARALNLADITLIFPLDFLRLPFMAVIGFLFYSEILDPWTALGAAIIFGSNYVSLRRESKLSDGASPGH